MIKIGTGAISWSSKLQSIIALSTTEAEYVAGCSTATEVIWLRHLLRDLGFTQTGPSLICIDNQSALSVAKNPEHHGRMKHLDLRTFALRHWVKTEQIEIQYLPTAEMPADLLTKPLGVEKVQRGRKMLGLV